MDGDKLIKWFGYDVECVVDVPRLGVGEEFKLFVGVEYICVVLSLS